MSPEDRAQLVEDIAEAIKTVPAVLSSDEQRWVRMAIQREAQSIELRQAIIEKTISSLIWSVFLGGFYLLLDFAKNHGFK